MVRRDHVVRRRRPLRAPSRRRDHHHSL